jgi:protein-S-isoprenylcysteine O-methyltransferase Ste14
MNWGVLIWTALGWLISGGLLYLTYKFGRDAAQEESSNRGARRAWKNGALAIVVVFVMVMFGTSGDPNQMDLTTGDWSRMLGILIAFVCAYSVGFFDGRRARRRR